MVQSAGRYRFVEFSRFGIPLQLVLLFTLPIIATIAMG